MSVPSRLVAQRPDIRQAEENLHAASAAVGIALANMLPIFNLTADAGTSALQFGSLFGPYTSFWEFGASLTHERLLDVLRGGHDGRPGSLGVVLHQPGTVIRLTEERRAAGNYR